MGIKKGTKLTNTPKEKTIRARIDEATSDKLNYLMKAQNTTLSDIVRKGIEIQYHAKKG